MLEAGMMILWPLNTDSVLVCAEAGGTIRPRKRARAMVMATVRTPAPVTRTVVTPMIGQTSKARLMVLTPVWDRRFAGHAMMTALRPKSKPRADCRVVAVWFIRGF